ncbi:MAG: hypothetical protein AAFQ63_03585 [Cyanobacteria bacterium J06621_11]
MTTKNDSVNIRQDDKQQTLSHYDAHLIPAETVAREAREGSHFGKVEHDDAQDKEHIHTRDGYTVDQEGLINNYAVEAPMHVDQSGKFVWWRKVRQDPIGWGTLLLFALGVTTLLGIMRMMSYAT